MHWEILDVIFLKVNMLCIPFYLYDKQGVYFYFFLENHQNPFVLVYLSRGQFCYDCDLFPILVVFFHINFQSIFKLLYAQPTVWHDLKAILARGRKSNL
jgi:hypothetical protein